MKRPQVPDWIRTYVPPRGWTNVFNLVPPNTHLYGTETLFGDWGGETLLLAKDGAPTEVIRRLRDQGESQPWRHACREKGDSGGWRTNERLQSLVHGLPGGFLYGSATAHLLYDDPRWSRSLPGFYSGELHQHLQAVLLWVIEHMPNLRRIACLGQESWFLTTCSIGRSEASRRFTEHRDARKALRSNRPKPELVAHPLYHPAARVSNEAQLACWTAMKRNLA